MKHKRQVNPAFILKYVLANINIIYLNSKGDRLKITLSQNKSNLPPLEVMLFLYKICFAYLLYSKTQNSQTFLQIQ
jgi:hypothetical protein